MAKDRNAAGNQRPYLLRAMHDWMTDNDFTPHIVVDAAAEELCVPDGHVRDGKIVLNVSYSATRRLTLGNESISFEARFNGVPRDVVVPVDAVRGIYAKETSQGMVFSDEDRQANGGKAVQPKADSQVQADRERAKTNRPKSSARPNLKVVK
jgi:stringent starvation protein B